MKPPADGARFVAERAGINLYSEQSLHSQLKEAYAEAGDRLESPVLGKVVDLVKSDGELVEVQTKSLGKIAAKVLALAAAGHRVRIVHPVSVETSIRRIDPATGEHLSTRRSPKRGDVYSVFEELVHASGLIAARNVSLEVVLVKTIETRSRDGSGSWRRRGDRTADRELAEILSSRVFSSRADWLRLIPRSLEPPWSSGSLGEALGIDATRARQILYCFAKAALVSEEGREGRRKLYSPARAPARASARPAYSRKSSRGKGLEK